MTHKPTLTLHEGDNRIVLRRLIDSGVRVHSVVTDPPYGLVSVTKRFGKSDAAPAKFGKDGAFQRQSKGFMGKKWDGTGIERDPEFWRLIYDILLPGGYCLAFSGARTGHWQAVAMEQAGFIMHPMIGWVFGQGFPKAHNAAMAIDKVVGAKGGRGAPKSAAHAQWINRGRMRGGEDADNHEGWQRPWMEDEDKVAAAASKYLPGSPEAAQWDGWAYGAQSMKPALEPIYMAQKPFSEKTGALNLLKHGVGAVNIDGCRVAAPGESISLHSRGKTSAYPKQIGAKYVEDYGCETKQNRPEYVGVVRDGRHPANLLHDRSEDVRALFPDTAPSSGRPRHNGDFKSVAKGHEKAHTTYGHSDNGGSAARFFNAFPPDDTKPLYYHPKAGKVDRAGSEHPTVKPVQLIRWLQRLVTPPGGTTLDPFAGSGTSGAAALAEGFSAILIEAEPAYAADIRRRFSLGGTVPDDLDDLLGGEPDPVPDDLLDDLLGGEIPELEDLL